MIAEAVERSKSEPRRQALCAEGGAGKVTQVLFRSTEDSESIPDIGIKIYILNYSLASFSLWLCSDHFLLELWTMEFYRDCGHFSEMLNLKNDLGWFY